VTLAHRRWILPVVLALGSLLVSLPRLGRPSYWYDEVATVSMLERSLGQLRSIVGDIDVVHVTYYLLLKPWEAVAGTSEVALRLPSALALAAAAAGFGLLVREVSGDRVAWVAGGVLVLLPGVSWVGLEARSYAFVLALVVWSTWALHRAVTRHAEGRGRRWWVVFAVLFAASVLMHVMAVLMVVPHVAMAVASRRARPVLLTDAVVIGLLVPFAVVASTQRGQVRWIDVSPRELAFDVGLEQLFVGQVPALTPTLKAAALVLAALLVALAVVALRGAADRPVAVVTAAAWLAGPTVLLAVPVLLDVQLYQQRYLVYAAPGACWLAAIGWVRLRLPLWSTALVAAVAAGAALVPSVVQGQQDAKGGEDYRALAALADGADAVVFATADARGIAIGYPDDFAGVDDPLLVANGATTSTLWGTQRPVEEVRLQGRVVLYVATAGDRAGRAAAVAVFDAQGCRAVARLRESRWTGVVHECRPG